MIQETYSVGKKIKDGEGAVWMVANAWEWKNYWCMQLIGVNDLEASGGVRIKMHEDTGGMALAVR
jgi:hypothetical protein